MKALSIKQPWSWLIVTNIKDIENRNWKTKFRGTIFVHAGKTFDKKGYDWINEHFKQIGKAPLPPIEFFKKLSGGIVGTVEITDCVNSSYSQWFFGKYGFVLKNAKEIDFNPCKG